MMSPADLLDCCDTVLREARRAGTNFDVAAYCVALELRKRLIAEDPARKADA